MIVIGVVLIVSVSLLLGYGLPLGRGRLSACTGAEAVQWRTTLVRANGEHGAHLHPQYAALRHHVLAVGGGAGGDVGLCLFALSLPRTRRAAHRYFGDHRGAAAHQFVGPLSDGHYPAAGVAAFLR